MKIKHEILQLNQNLADLAFRLYGDKKSIKEGDIIGIRKSIENIERVVSRNARISKSNANTMKKFMEFQKEFDWAIRIINFARDYDWTSDRLRKEVSNVDIKTLNYNQVESVPTINCDFEELDTVSEPKTGTCYFVDSNVSLKTSYYDYSINVSDQIKEAVEDALNIKKDVPKVKFEDTALSVIVFPWKYDKVTLYNVAKYIKDALDKDLIVKRY